MELRSLAQSVIRDPSRIDDILQEAYARTLKSGREFATPTDALRYLRTAVLTTAIDAYRRMRRHQKTFPKRIVEEPPATGSLARDDPLTLLLKQQAGGEWDQLVETVLSAVHRLPLPQKEAIEFFFGPRRSGLKEVCRETGVPYSTLRSRMLKGIDQIRELLREQGVDGFTDMENPDEMR